MSGVSFACGSQRLRVNARITIDASEWGDIIRLSGAANSAGPDSSARFGETNAPETIDDTNRNEMNPVTALAAIAASIALPPASRMRTPACEARN